MLNKLVRYISLLTFFLLSESLIAQIYPDQFYEMRIDSIIAKIESSQNIKISLDGKSIILDETSLDGYIILKEQSSLNLFNQGLPSYNGKASGDKGSFKVQMRFPYLNSWSPWLTVGYWKNNIWSSYGLTSYGGGYVDIDYVKLNSYINKWQFKVILTRSDIATPSPSIHKLSFFVSDSRTTSNVNINQLVNDKPEAIFIPTSFVYQYGVDPVIGKDICSPSTVSMILKSYNIPVDTYTFAVATYDPFHKLFGVWPRVVQNASEFGLDGAVTRYRNWSETKKVLDAGGRIGMSIGQPLYAGHIVMLAGFSSNGSPIVHDPAKSSGQAYLHDKAKLSEAWFAKGGIAYTFYPSENIVTVNDNLELPVSYELFQNFPNPFNPQTIIGYQISSSDFVSLKVYDITGQEVATLVNENKSPGRYEVLFDGSNLASGIYLYRLQSGNFSQIKKFVLMK
ncbi:MAG: T9SS type A sorting domain-containing protein [Melioribacteraceae bacterium]|nr:T9SS type A sorting domain-containing protein [Melioribacteraceae bacterium]